MPICRSVILALVALVALVGFGASGSAPAQETGDGAIGVALVVGNEAYLDLPVVTGATADAASVGIYLRQLGFAVQQHVNLTQGELLAASQRFIKALAPGQVALVYFSGHVLQLNGTNFLIPTNASLDRATSLLSSGLPLDTLINRIDGMELSQALFFLEAGLRVDPTGDGALANGMATPPQMSIPAVFALSVEPGQTIAVADPTLGDFTAKILEQATIPGVSLQEAMANARDEMATRRGAAPPPWVRDTLGSPLVMMATAAQPGVDTSEQRIWDAVLEQPDDRRRMSALSIYLQLYPDGVYAAEAAEMAAALERAMQTGDAGSSGDGDVVVPGGNTADPNAAGDSGTGGDVDVDGGEAVNGAGDAGTVDLPVDNRPPSFATPDTVLLVAGGDPVVVDLPQPTDPDGDTLEIEVVALPGSVVVSSSGRPLQVGDLLTVDQLNDLVFGAAGAAEGDQALVLAIRDTAGASLEARIAIRVAPPTENRPPVAVNLPTLSLPADSGPVDLEIPPPTDPDGDLLTIVVDQLPKFGVVRAGGNPIAQRESIPIEELGSLNYVPSPSQSGDAGSFVLEVSDTRGNAVRFGVAVRVTPAPTAEGRHAWEPSSVGQHDARMAQAALQALGFYDGTLDGIFGRGSQAALAAYQDSIGDPPTGTLSLRQRAELAAAGAEAAAQAARVIASEAEAAAARARQVAAGEDAAELSYSIGVYRGEVHDGAANGYGVIQAQGSQSFAGLFENNVRKLGVYTFSPGDRYTGEISNDLPAGLGVRNLQEGWVFAGQWAGGQVEGLGVSETTGGATVGGEWRANQLSGYGAVVDDQNGRRVGIMEASTFTALY